METKKKNTKLIWGIVIGVLVLGLIIYLMKSSKKLPSQYQDKKDAAQVAETGEKIPIDCSSMTDDERAQIANSNTYTCK